MLQDLDKRLLDLYPLRVRSKLQPRRYVGFPPWEDNVDIGIAQSGQLFHRSGALTRTAQENTSAAASDDHTSNNSKGHGSGGGGEGEGGGEGGGERVKRVAHGGGVDPIRCQSRQSRRDLSLVSKQVCQNSCQRILLGSMYQPTFIPSLSLHWVPRHVQVVEGITSHWLHSYVYRVAFSVPARTVSVTKYTNGPCICPGSTSTA